MSIKTLRSDNGGEYISHEFIQFNDSKGIIHETTCPYTPQQNGVSKRKNRHILETVRTIMTAAHMPQQYWSDAVGTSVYLLNRISSRLLEF